MASQIFISYRREENRYQARALYDAFQKSHVSDRVFFDVDSIPPGANFKEIIRSQVEQCDVLLALIGVNWAKSINPVSGKRKLDEPNDFVRIEIGVALHRGIPVVPVLIDNAPLPEAEQLPDDLRALLDRQAEFVNFRTFDTDVERLIAGLADVYEKNKQPNDSTKIASNVIAAAAQRDWDKLWDQTADLYKQKTQVKKAAFAANWALSRGMMGNLTNTSVVDEAAAPDPARPWGYTGNIYTVTFSNTYTNGNFYERVMMIQEGGAYRVINFFTAPR